MRVMAGLTPVIFHCMPGLNGQGHFCEQLSKDLETRGLIALSFRVFPADCAITTALTYLTSPDRPRSVRI
jgi:hypothetical protein